MGRVKSGKIVFQILFNLLHAISDIELIFVEIGNLLRNLNTVLQHFSMTPTQAEFREPHSELSHSFLLTNAGHLIAQKSFSGFCPNMRIKRPARYF